MGAIKSKESNVNNKEYNNNIEKLRKIGSIIINTEIENLINEDNCENIEIFTKKTLLKVFNKKEIKYIYNGIEEKKDLYFRNKINKKERNISKKKEHKNMCVGISKFYNDIINIFIAIVRILDADYNYNKKTHCNKVLGNKCTSIITEQNILMSIKRNNVYGIKDIIKTITVKIKDENKKTFSNVFKQGFKSLNELYKNEYDFEKRKYKELNVKNNPEYKEFIKKIYNAYRLGYTNALIKNNKPKNETMDDFDTFWNDYIKEKKYRSSLLHIYKQIKLNKRDDEELKIYEKDIIMNDDFKKKYNEKITKIQKKKEKQLSELFKFLNELIEEDDKGDYLLNKNLTISKLEELKKKVREKILNIYIEGHNDLLDCLMDQIKNYEIDIKNKNNIVNSDGATTFIEDDVNNNNLIKSPEIKSNFLDLIKKNKEKQKNELFLNNNKFKEEKEMLINKLKNKEIEERRNRENLKNNLKNELDKNNEELKIFYKKKIDDDKLEFNNKLNENKEYYSRLLKEKERIIDNLRREYSNNLSQNKEYKERYAKIKKKYRNLNDRIHKLDDDDDDDDKKFNNFDNFKFS